MTAARRGEKNKRIEMMKTKILEEALLYEDEDEDEEDNLEDVYESQEEGSEVDDSEIDPERIGPDGAIYASSSSGEEMVENENGQLLPKRQFWSFKYQHAYGNVDRKGLKVKKKNNAKLTKGTDPKNKDILSFMVDSSIGCPMFLPLNEEDVKLTNVTVEAAII
jgi:hypothetical protein